MQNIRFGCTQCGTCCHNHSLPLTLDEAAVWLEEGGNVALFCEAHLSLASDHAFPGREEHRRKRSFPVSCGSNKVHVTTILVGIVSGACRNLGEDMKCRIYERRPLVCRIYPAEISPFINFEIARKVCPPEAWSAGDTLLSDGKPVDAHLQWLIQKSRDTDYGDAHRKLQLCRDLGMDTSAIADEGFVTYEPDSRHLLTALRKARSCKTDEIQEGGNWRLYTPAAQATNLLVDKGFEMLPSKPSAPGLTYIHAPARLHTPELVA